MARYLVTGATGFLGGELVRRLREEGCDIIATGRDEGKLSALPISDKNRLALDLSMLEPADLRWQLDGVTHIVHCAALSSPWGLRADFERANIVATDKVIALAGMLQVQHLIHISTPAVYFRFQDQLNIAEDATLPKPVSDYARTKAIADGRVLTSGLPHTIIRPRGIYGVRDTALLPRLIRAARTGTLPRFRGGRAVTDITHVADVVEAILSVIRQPAQAIGRVFNISGGEALPIRQIVDQATTAVGITPRWRDLPVMPVLAAVRVAELAARLHPARPEPLVTAYGLGIFAYSQTLDLSNARRHLQWRPRISFAEGLLRTFDTGRRGAE
ncbi:MULTISPECIES: NAD-dependent epimerase/dehydratase family protein [Rhizobium]|uniref:NAD(P)-dependent oxidoreductase n=1 Tax=Rhizobium rhododendri TaxID=2506430 RepID=A0ABY8IQF3_9HYPH|nr:MULTISPECIES: NAD(P)-dependent oxidoreductase [Rhizobium]TQX85178.1 NAD(P)-dependent oxidoreductase [Rhizobium sp. rho-13.1]TQY09466.1 NAD(P)-dependent oxidoreductase [Rhizobium sp. rho-1.1]WFS25948.1 NAD(P)-dependent oxidoreductase [Rhizobium rhododendri]